MKKINLQQMEQIQGESWLGDFCAGLSVAGLAAVAIGSGGTAFFYIGIGCVGVSVYDVITQ